MSKMPSSEALALHIVETLQRASHTAYFAGGCVRDRLMNRTPADYDVATSALPDQVLKLFPYSQKVGAAFGVILVRQNNFTVEVATFRSDGTYSDGRRPDSVRFTTAHEDAKRRDFTCNGLFFDPIANQLHDFVGGVADIQSQTLRAIGNPRERFGEDHLRLLRAIRFAAKLHFTIEPFTAAAIRELSPQINTISRERIGEEIRMMLEHLARTEALSLLAASGNLFPAVFPTKEIALPEIFSRTALLPANALRPLVLAGVLLDISALTPPAILPEDIDHLRTSLMLSNDETAELRYLAAGLPILRHWSIQPRHILKRLMADPRFPALRSLHATERSTTPDYSALESHLDSLQREGVAPSPFITGEDLIALGATPGPLFKKILEDLYNRQLNLEFASRNDALLLAQSHLRHVPPHP